METLDQLVALHPVFQGLPPADLELITGCGRNARFDAGTMIFREGDPADNFYLLRAGDVALEVAAPGRRPLVVQTAHPGDMLGYSWLFPPYRARFDARAVGPVGVIEFDGACLRGKCDADPRLGYELMKRFSQVLLDRLQATRIQLLDVYGRDDRV